MHLLISHIKSMHLFSDGGCSAKIVCDDGVTVEIEIPREALEGKSMDERYKTLIDKANRYVSCAGAQSTAEDTVPKMTAEEYWKHLGPAKVAEVMSRWNIGSQIPHAQSAWEYLPVSVKGIWTAQYDELID